MSLLDKLLQADVKNLTERETAKIKSKRLARAFGEDKPVEITVQELSSRRVTEIMAKQFDKKGNFDLERNFRAKAITAVEGVVDPCLKDKALQEHFNCHSPADLAELLFGQELTKISDLILTLSGVTDDEEENETIKNS